MSCFVLFLSDLNLLGFFLFCLSPFQISPIFFLTFPPKFPALFDFSLNCKLLIVTPVFSLLACALERSFPSPCPRKAFYNHTPAFRLCPVLEEPDLFVHRIRFPPHSGRQPSSGGHINIFARRSEDRLCLKN